MFSFSPDLPLNKTAAYFLILFFILVSLFGIQFHYDLRNSGRYLLPVLQSADPQLFSDDSVVDSLEKYPSLFYEALAWGFGVSGGSPEQVKSVVYVLYVVAQVFFLLLLFYLARAFGEGFWFFLILAAWTSLPQSVPVGNIILFKPLVTHETAAFFLGTAALIFWFQKRPRGFWICVGLSIFFHSLMAFHVFLLTAPPILLIERKKWKTHVGGLAVLGMCSLFYLGFLSPPLFTGEEASLFILEKGTCEHVSPFNQSLYGWFWMGALVVTALAAAYRELWGNSQARWLSRFIIWGIPAGLFLSLTAVWTQLPLLALFQPMRLFLWITFMTYLLIAGGAVRSIKKDFWEFVLLLGVIGLSILSSGWALVFMGVYWIYPLLKKNKERFQTVLPLSLEHWMKWGLGVGVVAMVLAWKPGWGVPRSPLPIGVGILLFSMTFRTFRHSFFQSVFLFLVLAYTVLSLSVVQHDLFEDKTDENWDKIRLWCRNHTQKKDVFLSPPRGKNFRILSWRTTVSEDMPALVWVDPALYERNHRRVEMVQEGLSRTGWDLNYLFPLAEKWDADYVLIQGKYRPPFYFPVYRSGPYRVFIVPDKES